MKYCELCGDEEHTKEEHLSTCKGRSEKEYLKDSVSELVGLLRDIKEILDTRIK